MTQSAAISSRAAQSSKPEALYRLPAGFGDELVVLDRALDADLERLGQGRFERVSISDTLGV